MECVAYCFAINSTISLSEGFVARNFLKDSSPTVGAILHYKIYENREERVREEWREEKS
jgi:hypothetical protein